MLQGIRIESDGDKEGVNENVAFVNSPPLIRTRRCIDQCVVQYRSEFPESVVTDEELIHTLVASKMVLVRDSNLISITFISHNEKLAKDVADIYAEVCEEMSCAQTNESFTGHVTVYKRVEVE